MENDMSDDSRTWKKHTISADIHNSGEPNGYTDGHLTEPGPGDSAQGSWRGALNSGSMLRQTSGSSVGSGGSLDWRKPPAKNKSKKKRLGISLLSEQSSMMEKRWNVFRSIPRDKDIVEPLWTIVAAQIFKFLVYIVLFGMVLGCGFLAHMIVLLMVSNLRAGRTFTPCRPYDNAVTYFYWALWVGISVPEIFTFCRCVRIVTFKFTPTPSVFLLAGAMIVETLRTLGLCILVFVVLPDLDSVRAGMLLCALATVPTFLSAFGHIGGVWRQTWLLVIADTIAFSMQATGLWLWPALDKSLRNSYLMPVALLLVSLGWWENFVSKSAELRFIAYLGSIKERLQRSRYKTNLAMSLWKILFSLFCMIIAAGVEHKVTDLFDFGTPFANLTQKLEDGDIDEEVVARAGHSREVIYLMLWLAFASMLCYQAAKFACKVKMERFSYAVPVICTIPLVVVSTLSLCETKREQPCRFHPWMLPDKIFFRCDYGDVTNNLIFGLYGWVWVLWFSSYLWIVSYMFTQKPSRLSKTDTLFVTPMYDGLFVSHSLALNRRRQHTNFRVAAQMAGMKMGDGDNISIRSEGTDYSLANSMTSLSLANAGADAITKIYICATMWHETANEMTQVLSSIMRMDEDQSARRNAQKYLKVIDPDYYELEAHIFFDNAWEYDEEKGFRVPNEYVEAFVSAVESAARIVHKVDVKMRPPIKIDVPYGGRLVWTLPGDTRLFVHLKDKTKIRHKKRWSQVMYMYYLLGYRIMELIPDIGRKQILADNTYILALDGDSNFSPSAVQKLVDLMKKHSRLGSACGRIHPIGTGMMVWYQKFEYAIAHWFQKATEHVFGCVLCSPGCFSLFRGSALMDDNVMNKYTALAVQPRHFVQYDQGEDRWLSTLILKQGYRIEYAAASDADTYAPEGFDEFFNQRRRWTPSSIANTLDLLFDYKRTVTNNDSISRPYIAYQFLVILFSLLSPSIIFTMLIFAQSSVFGWDSWYVLWGNLLPVLFFCLVCFLFSSETQLGLAKLLGVGYAFIMMSVLVGTGIQISREGAAAPTSLFVLSLSGVFTAAAFFHPREFANIFHGIIFFLMIPSTYILMALYALINLNVINWGTREAIAKAIGEDVGDTKIQQWMKKMPFMKRAGEVTNPADSGKMICACERLCQCFMCPEDPPPHGAHKKEDLQLQWVGNKLEKMDWRLEKIEDRVVPSLNKTVLSPRPNDSGEDFQSVLATTLSRTHPDIVFTQPTHPAKAGNHDGATEMKQFSEERYRVPQMDGEKTGTPATTTDPLPADNTKSQKGNENGTPGWMSLSYLRNGVNDILDEMESQFWTDFIDQYVKPQKKSPQEEANEVVELQSLRNKIAFAILCINGLLVLIIYLLQKHKEVLAIRYVPYENYTQLKPDPLTGKEVMVEEPLEIEPIGFVIILFLLLILVIQTFGLLRHRFHTLSHILASTVLSCFRRKRRDRFDPDDMLDSNAVDIARNLQRLNGSDPKEEEGKKKPKSNGKRKRRKRVVVDLERARKNKHKPNGLNAAFQKRFFNFNPEKPNEDLTKGVHFSLDANYPEENVEGALAQALGNRRDGVLADFLQSSRQNLSPGKRNHAGERIDRNARRQNSGRDDSQGSFLKTRRGSRKGPKAVEDPDIPIFMRGGGVRSFNGQEPHGNSSFVEEMRAMLDGEPSKVNYGF